jgi:tRNA (mo5U34)-methyltransferase
MRQRSTSWPERSRRDQLVERIANLAPWFQNMDLGGVMTAPHRHAGDDPGSRPRLDVERVYQALFGGLAGGLDGKTVLDIDCNAGFYAIEMKRRGAARVVGIDSDPRHLQQAGLAAEVLGADIELRRLAVYEVADLGERFDLVLFTGALHHLRYPLHALELVREHVLGDAMALVDASRGNASRGDTPRGDSQAGARDRAGLEDLLCNAGFAIEARLEEEVYICRAACPRKDEP